MPSSRQVGRIASSMPRETSEYSICRSTIGWTAAARLSVSAPTSERPMCRTCPSGDGADRLLDRHVGIEPRRPVDVDMVGAQPLQRIGGEILHRRGPGVVADPASGRPAHAAEFHADQRLVAAAALQRFGDQHLVMAHAIEIAGVEQGDACLEGGMYGCDAFAPVSRTVEIRHAHAAKTQSRAFRAGLPELALFHRFSPSLRRWDLYGPIAFVR